MKKGLMILANGFEELEAIGTYALLKRANLDFEVYSLNESYIKGQYNLPLIVPSFTDSKLNLADYDFLVIAGGREHLELRKNESFLNVIKEFNNSKKLIAAICAGPTILGDLGLLNNKNYTCFNSMNQDFKGTFIDKYVVVYDNLITAKSCAATIDFALEIIKYLNGEQDQKRVKEEIYYDHR